MASFDVETDSTWEQKEISKEKKKERKEISNSEFYFLKLFNQACNFCNGKQ